MEYSRLIISIFLISTSQIIVASKYKDYRNYQLFSIEGSKISIEKLNNILENDNKPVLLMYDEASKSSTISSGQLLVPPELAGFIKELVQKGNLTATLLYNDVSEVIRLEKGFSRATFSWNAYYDVKQIYRFIKDISKAYSNWTEVIEGGKSYEGRKIIGIRINTPYGNDRMPLKPVFFIETGIHAREWIGPATTTYFINQLLTSTDPNIKWLRDQFDWRIFPTVNPDGYHYSYVYDRYWRKTRSRSSASCYGADPNRNWDYNWGQYSTSSNPCDYQLYAGSRPFSEVETKTLSSYISSIDHLLFYVAFHSYASLLLIPYSDSTDHVDNYDDLVQIGKTSIEYGYRVNNAKYDGPAPAAEVLYKASGGSMDWVRYALKTPLVYTYELRGNSFHWPPSKIPEQGEEVTQMMLGLAKEARNLGYF